MSKAWRKARQRREALEARTNAVQPEATPASAPAPVGPEPWEKDASSDVEAPSSSGAEALSTAAPKGGGGPVRDDRGGTAPQVAVSVTTAAGEQPALAAAPVPAPDPRPTGGDPVARLRAAAFDVGAHGGGKGYREACQEMDAAEEALRAVLAAAAPAPEAVPVAEVERILNGIRRVGNSYSGYMYVIELDAVDALRALSGKR